MAINVKRIREGKEFCKVVTATVSDLSDLLDGKVKAEKNANEVNSFVSDAKADSYWSNDPGTGNITNRVRGDFEYARDVMKSYKPIDLAGNIESLQASIEWGRHDGTFIDFDAYFNGEPEFMGEVVTPVVEDGERTMRIAVGIGGNCGIKAEELVKRAARVLRVANAYSEAGYNVELYAFCPVLYDSGNYDRKCIAIIDCSGSTVGQSVAMMSSAKVFRSLVFAMICWEDTVFCCGYPVNHTQNRGAMDSVTKQIRSVLGANTRVIHAGASDEQIKEDFEK
jgi:hypothetical protein